MPFDENYIEYTEYKQLARDIAFMTLAMNQQLFMTGSILMLLLRFAWASYLMKLYVKVKVVISSYHF